MGERSDLPIMSRCNMAPDSSRLQNARWQLVIDAFITDINDCTFFTR